MSSYYIVPNDVLQSTPPQAEHHATCPADSTQSLVVVLWDNSTVSAELEFESIPGVLWLGHPWDALPEAAIALFASLQDPSAETTGATAAAPTSDVPAAPETVANSLRKLAWPGARLR